MTSCPAPTNSWPNRRIRSDPVPRLSWRKGIYSALFRTIVPMKSVIPGRSDPIWNGGEEYGRKRSQLKRNKRKKEKVHQWWIHFIFVFSPTLLIHATSKRRVIRSVGNPSKAMKDHFQRNLWINYCWFSLNETAFNWRPLVHVLLWLKLLCAVRIFGKAMRCPLRSGKWN